MENALVSSSNQIEPLAMQDGHMKEEEIIIKLLELWAEVFRVHGDGEYMKWERVSDDVVPVNISCIEDTPQTLFQITAYNRHVEKIFDVKIIQPGTIICPATDCFVHWRDPWYDCEWGLNFTSATDARKFKDCCSYPTQRFARKASSANSLRLSPPKQRAHSKLVSASSPNSPVTESRRVVSSPFKFVLEKTDSQCYGSDTDTDTQDFHSDPGILEQSATMPRVKQVQETQMFHQATLSKPASELSVYDNVSNSSPLRKCNDHDGQISVIKKSPSSGSPVPSLSICTKGDLSKSGPASAIVGEPKKDLSHQPPTKKAYGSSVQELSPCPKESKIIETIRMETAFIGEASKQSERTSIAPGPHQLHGSSSESPEWPSPPEPLTPQTPLLPTCNIDFDSDSLKRMLRSLPVSPMEKGDHDQGFHEDPYLVERPVTQVHRRYPPVLRTKSLNAYDRSTRPIIPNHPISIMYPYRDDSFLSVLKHADIPKSKQAKMLVEYELHLRNKCARDSYPDSGIGGVASETTGSVWSGDSTKSTGVTQSLGTNQDNHASGSNTGSAGNRHSDYIFQLGDSLDVKQFLNLEPSDEEPVDSDGSIHTMTSESHMSYGKQSGAIRKAGWLIVKNWLIHKKRKLELAPKRNWKRYWVCLKGTMLLFFDCDEESAVTEDSVPRHILIIEGGIAQAVPEHPKRENIFSLSTAFGDAYLFQAPSQIELENWIRAIHSACASLFARQHGKDNTLKLLKNEIQRLETSIDMDVKMKKMAELQLTVVTDPKSRQAIVKQINQWEENLEKLYIEQYRLRCYMASLQGSELPNPKGLLANVSKASKATLGRLGIFTVTSFHALVCARSPPNVSAIHGKMLKKGTSAPKTDDSISGKQTQSNVQGSTTHNEKLVYKAPDIDEKMNCREGTHRRTDGDGSKEGLSRISLPHNQTILVGVDEKTTVQDLLEFVCGKRQLSPSDHFVRLQLMDQAGNYGIPVKNQLIKKLKYEAIEVCQKCLFHVELSKSVSDPEFGFRIEAELADNFERDDELQVYICEIKPGGLAHRKGLIPGDEILIINGKIVSELDMVYIETLLQDSQSLCMTVRTCRTQCPTSSSTDHTDAFIHNTVCPPPPSQSRISEKVIGDLTVPSPTYKGQLRDCRQAGVSPKKTALPRLSPAEIDVLLKGAEQVTAICRDTCDPSFSYGMMDSPMSPRPLSEAQRLRKVIMELLETERGYVKDLNFLIECYLVPLKGERFLTTDEIEQLFGNIQEIVQFQEQFLQSLEEAIELGGDFFTAEDPKQYRRVLFSLGGSFLYYANHFKVYSSFCASHSRSQKILNPDANVSLKEFLQAKNPKQQHSATLESYLIKPIQRILKYPLLLQQLCHLTDPDTDEHYHLAEALRGMEAVAEHINEMQKIYEEYGASFDELSKMYKENHPHNKPVDLSVGELQMYGTVQWCNAIDFLGKIKKGTDLENVVFVFKTGIAFLCRERVKRRKSKGSSSKAPISESYDAIPRFRTLIPVHEVQVFSGASSDCERHYWWQLVHSKSEAEGRPERLYQFCNCTTEAKTDFMKVIRQTIRDSVRKMAVPSTRQSTKGKYIPFGGKRLECLNSNARTLSKKRNSKGHDLERHSMDFEENFNVMQYDNLFRTRSKTIGDLNEVAQGTDESSLLSSEAQTESKQSPASSSSNLSGSSQSGSSKPLQTNISPADTPAKTLPNPSGSPVWKPRGEVNQSEITTAPAHSTTPITESTTPKKTSAPGDYSDVVYRADPSNLFLHQPSHCITYKDTEC